MLKTANPTSGTTRFGRSVSISGNYVIIGAENTSPEIGKVQILVRIGSFWQSVQKFNDQFQTPSFFGNSVAIDGNNKRFLIGAQGEASEMGKAVFGKVN